MLSLQTLKSHLNEECAIVYREFSAICGTNIQAATMLSKFVYWSDVVHRTEPQKCGWFYKTAQHLYDELGFTRRAYEKARNFLIKKGLLQYRRGGIHGKMHFCVNFGRLLELVYEIKGMVAPKDVLNTQIDRDNYTIPKFIPLDKWNNYLDVYKEKKGKFPSNKQKSALIKQLAHLQAKFDVKQIMERSIACGWVGFFPLEHQPAQHIHHKQTQQAMAIQKMMVQMQAASETQVQNSKEKSVSDDYVRQMLASIKKVIKR